MIEGHGDDIYRYGNIRLNFSSNIYPRADITPIVNFLKEKLQTIRSYPEPSASSLEKAIAEKYGIAEENVLATAGATEAIYLIAQTLRSWQTFTVKYPAFSEYEDACRLNMYREDSFGNLMWICNPCNPTGEVFPGSYIYDLLSKHRYVIVDQSYEDYTQEKVMTPAEAVRIPNLIQIHSMTKKYAVPGLRIGFITANSGVIRLLRAGVKPWSLSSLAIEAGKFLIEGNYSAVPDMAEYLRCTQRLRFALTQIEGIEAKPTKTNFVLCRLKQGKASELKTFLANEKKILIRDASNFRGLFEGHFRVASSIDRDNAELIDGIKEYLDKQTPA
ncbi:MAG: aminotransferase class I/II-fold pyridoxal phosphate-dependent enzyme [Bacteroidales bacterium]|nr:aminotransferase class I/II-fold pyridoxal phosphate-dependent enzyme [Bacteroidales bacterium]